MRIFISGYISEYLRKAPNTDIALQIRIIHMKFKATIAIHHVPTYFLFRRSREKVRPFKWKRDDDRGNTPIQTQSCTLNLIPTDLCGREGNARTIRRCSFASLPVHKGCLHRS